MTLHDEGDVELWDLSAAFVFSATEIGRNRADASVSKLQELNHAVVVRSLKIRLTKEDLSNFEVLSCFLLFMRVSLCVCLLVISEYNNFLKLTKKTAASDVTSNSDYCYLETLF